MPVSLMLPQRLMAPRLFEGLRFGQLKPSWKQLPVGSVRVHVRGNGYMILAVDNKTEGRTLFILMAESGQIYDVNFTGTFKGLVQRQTEPPRPQ